MNELGQINKSKSPIDYHEKTCLKLCFSSKHKKNTQQPLKLQTLYHFKTSMPSNDHDFTTYFCYFIYICPWSIRVEVFKSTKGFLSSKEKGKYIKSSGQMERFVCCCCVVI